MNIPPNLPDFLSPVLEYLSETLPYPVYSILVKLLSYSVTLFTALSALAITLISSHPSEWTAQTVLPPLISLLAAYLAIASLYRTTSFMVRTTFWFIKWGSLLGALLAGAGWFMGQAGDGVGQLRGVPLFGGFLLDMLDGQGQNAAATSRTRSKSRPFKSSKSKARTKKPKPWESFDKIRDWQYQDNQAEETTTSTAQQIVSHIMDTAGSTFGDDGWWKVAKGVIERNLGGGTSDEGGAEGPQQRSETRKTKTGSSSRSR